MISKESKIASLSASWLGPCTKFTVVSRTLSENDRLICECLLLLEELTQALQLANRNNSPGPDGLTVEFYLAFWSSLGPLLVEVFKESFCARELCDSTKSSVPRLVHKKVDKRDLKN